MAIKLLLNNTSEIFLTNLEVLFLGPGIGSNGASEVFNLPSLTRANCSPPTFPNGEYWGYVGTLTTDGPLLCGGSVRRVFHLECHLLANSGEWVGMPPMQNARVWAAAVTLGDAWLVTGKNYFSSSG